MHPPIDFVFKWDDEQLRRYVQKLIAMPTTFDHILVEALNETGDDLRRDTTRAVADANGMTIASTERYVSHKYATVSEKVYELRISLGGIETEKNSKPLPQRGFPGREVRDFPDETKLVNLVTMKDGHVCPICEEIEKEGPYSMEEFDRLRDAHPHLLNRNLHCRCSLVPFKPQGRTPMKGADKATIDLNNAQHDLVASIRAKTRQMIRERK